MSASVYFQMSIIFTSGVKFVEAAPLGHFKLRTYTSRKRVRKIFFFCMKFVDETSDVTSLKITLEGKNVRVLFQKKKKKKSNN